MEHALEEQGDDDDDGADGRGDPCRRVLQRYLPRAAFPFSSHDGKIQRPTSSADVLHRPFPPVPLLLLE
jgi:hypothetical protein